MIFHPQPGQIVTVRYRASVREKMPNHGRRGRIVRVGRGPGPINCEVEFLEGMDFDPDRYVVVPRGNLFAEPLRRGDGGVTS